MKFIWRALIYFLAKTGDAVILSGRLLLWTLLLLGDLGDFVLRLTSQVFKKPKLPSIVHKSFFPKFNKLLSALRPLFAAETFFFKKLSTRVGQFFLALFSYLNKIGHAEVHLPLLKFPKISRRPTPTLPKTFKPAFFIRPRLRFPKIPGFIWGFFLGGGLIFFGFFIPYQIRSFVNQLPHPRLLSQRVIPVTTQIFDRNGVLLYEIHGPEDRKPVTLAQIPEVVKQATLAIEDRGFYSHPGFSITAIARAARETFINHNVQGGSTITQQLIKNALLTSEITLTRKAKELVLAFWAEKIYTKDEILEMYFNQVPYGGTAWGIEAAAQTYFGKKVTDLNLAEAAFLAGLPAAPTYYSPYGRRPDLARARQAEVLDRMVEDGYISQAEADTARNQTLDVLPALTNIQAPHFVMWVRSLVAEKFGTWTVEQGGLRIYTTLDVNLQNRVQNLVSKNIEQLLPLQVTNGAALVANPQTGEILAMVGSKDYFANNYDGNVNVVISSRQPGSAIKVVNYAAALENGLTAASVINDSPVTFQIPGQSAYAPVNYDGRFHGLMTLRTALANSYNVPAVKTLNQIGVKTMVEMGKRLGITTWENDQRFGLALTLGGGEVTLYDLTQVYAVLANQGNLTKFDPFTKITDFSGRIYYERPSETSNHAVSPAISFILSDILSDNAARSAAFGPRSALYFPNHTVAVKTGTTNDKRDNWTLGYTPDLVVGVWVGNNDNSPMNPYLTSGVTGAAPIFNQIMNFLISDLPNKPFPKPVDIVEIPCHNRVEYFIRGTEPKDGCRPFPSTSPSPVSQAILVPSPSVIPSIQLTNTQPQSKIRPGKNKNRR